MNQVLSVIASRRSHRAYRETQLTQEQLDAILTAALQAPTGINRQAWHFSVVQNQALLAEINEACRENALKKDVSQRSARFSDESFHVFYHAPTVIFISTPHGDYQVDCGIAVQTIALAAESLGLGSVILGIPREAFEGEKAADIRKALHFPENHDFVIAISLGTPADDKPAHEIGEGKISLIP